MITKITRYFLLLLSVFAVGRSFAQDDELGFSLGTMYYLGELNQKQFNSTKPALGIFFRKGFNRRLAWETHLNYGRVQAADSLQKSAELVNRNLNFRSDLVELGTQLEINYFDFQLGSKRNFATPYLFIGFAAFYSNPQGFYNNQWVDLRDIGTEGQLLNGGKKYNLINFAIPMGVGFRLGIGNHFCLTIFSGFRKTFSDYIDDVGGVYADPNLFNANDAVFVDRSLVKQRPDGTNTGLMRGNENTKDWYNFTGFALAFKTNRKKTQCNWNL